jgi:hypothetical protein
VSRSALIQRVSCMLKFQINNLFQWLIKFRLSMCDNVNVGNLNQLSDGLLYECVMQPEW